MISVRWAIVAYSFPQLPSHGNVEAEHVRWTAFGWINAVVFVVVVACDVSGAEGVPFHRDRQLIVNGVSDVTIDPGAVPGPLCVTGEQAFPILLGKSGRFFQPVVAAGYHGLGRVVAFGHTHAFVTEKALMSQDTRRFVMNCLRWAGGSRQPLRVATYRMPSVVNWLRNDMEARRLRIDVMDCTQINPSFLSQADVLVLNSHDLSPATISLVGEFVRRGGGLLVGGLGWGWLQLNPGKNLRDDFPGNRLLGAMGIFWADGYIERSTSDGFTAFITPGKEHHALGAASLLAKHLGSPVETTDSALEQASHTVALAITVVPPDHPLRRSMRRPARQSEKAIVATPQAPLRESDKTARALLQLQVRELLQAEGAAVEAHPAAAVFPGQVPPGARPIRKTVSLDPSWPGWQSTGLYAKAGQPITIEFDSPAVVGRVFVQIGCHTDTLWHLPEWKRVPEIVKRTTVQSQRVTIGSPFGGLIYLGISGTFANSGPINCRIDGAFEAPAYIHGQTTVEEWKKIRLHPAPWAELISPRIILTLPSEFVRGLDNPYEVMDFWTAVIEACDRLAGGPARPDAQRIVCDVQISAGYMHSGYPIMTHLDIAPVLVDVDRLRRNDHGGVWGLFHEIGHNYQSPDWTFEGTGEVTNNLFTVYVFDHLCQVPREKTHPALAHHERTQRRQKYFSDGASFEQWKKDPFLALDMYLQLQEAFGWEPFEKVFAEYRTLSPQQRPKTDTDKRDQWLIRFSRTVGQDLSAFFRRWGVPVSEDAVRSLRNLPPWQPPL